MRFYRLILLMMLMCLGVRAQSPPPYNVLWLTGESMQAKHLGCYGYDKPTSPAIDAFARTGVLFEQCVSPSGWTSESMVSNLTGVYSPVHGVITRDRGIPPEWDTPMEQLRERGYVLPRMSPYQAKAAQEHMGYTEAEPNNEELWDWLEKHRNERFFVWYHLWESHLPYDPPEPYRGLFWKDEYIHSRDSKWRIDLVRTMNIIPRSSVRFDPAQDAPGIRALYDGALRMVDDKFAKILEAVNRLGLRENTLIVFSADHGDGLLEHGLVGHASTLRGGMLYDEIVHVPLILSLPGKLPEGLRIVDQVGGVDVMPTVFDLLGMPPRSDFQGESLMPLIQRPDEPHPERVRFAASSFSGYQEEDPEKVENLQRAARMKDWKLIYQTVEGREEYELYHLATDPGEQKDVKALHPATFRRMKKRMFDWLRECETHQVEKEQGD